MQFLYKYAYENRKTAQEEYQRRIQSPTARMLPFVIKPMHQQKEFQLYYLPTDRMANLTESIFVQDAQIGNLTSVQLPKVALECFLRESLIDELQNSNDLEGIRSTRKELAAGLDAMEQKTRKNVRFEGMARAYSKLLDDKPLELKKPHDVRRIYDELTQGEIAKNELPDGILFRKDAVYVRRISRTGTVVHEGVLPEERIIEGIQDLIDFIQITEIPFLYRIAIAHYYFAYLHPFYDGNGRTGRYISNVLIRKELSQFSSISLSRSCNQNRNTYAKLFERGNSAVNQGEMNAFIEGFLDLLVQGQATVLQELTEKKQLLEQAKERIYGDHQLKKTDELIPSLLYLFAQNFYFAQDAGFEVRHLLEAFQQERLNVPEYRLRKLLKQLVNQNKLKMVGKRPAIYHLSPHFLEVETKPV